MAIDGGVSDDDVIGPVIPRRPDTVQDLGNCDVACEGNILIFENEDRLVAFGLAIGKLGQLLVKASNKARQPLMARMRSPVRNKGLIPWRGISAG